MTMTNVYAQSRMTGVRSGKGFRFVKKNKRWLLSSAKGLAAGALSLIAAEGLIRNMGDLAGKLGPSMGLDAESALQIAEVFGQLKDAQIALPVIYMLPAALLAGLLSAALFRKKGALRAVLHLLYWLIVLILLTAGAIAFAEINGVVTMALLRVLLPVAGAFF